MQLKPAELFPIVRQLDDAGDVTTYYIQAVVRNARTLTTIDTVSLTDNGNQLFSYNWTVPQDPSGEGFYIEIRTRVYTNAGHTVAAENYGIKSDTYLVQSRPNLNRGFGGGGIDIDYKKIQKMIDESVSKIKFPEIPKHEPMDMMPMMDKMETLKTAVESIVIPEPAVTDLSGLKSQLEAVSSELEGIKGQISSLPEPERLDLSPVLDELSKPDGVNDNSKKVMDSLRTFLLADIEEIKSKLENLDERFSKIQITIPNTKEEPKENE